jgi:hypothetical protein
LKFCHLVITGNKSKEMCKTWIKVGFHKNEKHLRHQSGLSKDRMDRPRERLQWTAGKDLTQTWQCL